MLAIIQIISFLIYGFYAFYVTLQSGSNKIEQIYFYPQSKNSKFCASIEDLHNILNSDYNKIKQAQDEEFEFTSDLKIVNIETQTQNMVSRADTYVLESIFIGGLTFTGFLTILSSDQIEANLNLFKIVYELLIKIVNETITLKFENFQSNISILLSGLNLFAFICLESILSSMFFIIVLATRISFSSLTDKLTSIIKILKLYNEKKERFDVLKLENNDMFAFSEKRINYLKDKINVSIDDANSILKKITPIFRYMTILRNIALIIFYMILISGGIFFSSSVSLTVIGFILLGYLLKVFYYIVDKKVHNKITKKYIK